MFTIEKIWIHSVNEFARKIAQRLPDLEPEFDMFGDWQDSKNFDFDIDCGTGRLTVIGTVRGAGEAIQTRRRTYEHPEEWEIDWVDISIGEITFWTEDGSEIEVDNEQELIDAIEEYL